jgi:hypothetical protein
MRCKAVRVFLRKWLMFKKEDVRVVAPASQFTPSKLRALPTDKEVIAQLFSDVFGSTRLLKVNVDEQVQKSILTIDEVALFNRYKFGVLYCKKGQTREDEMFGNGRVVHGGLTFSKRREASNSKPFWTFWEKRFSFKDTLVMLLDWTQRLD